MAVQRALAAAGHYEGEIDGIPGSGDCRAIADWQASMDAPATGYLVPGQVRTLVSIAPPPVAAPAPSAPAFA
ncbi:peptidoglycan-binding domain-containing protein [Paracoccus spongiarum]|uniref:Peptidoglycan-binding domain-containing protein n=1 Tax=Paracoccus spongiarum TaxID=3064387 RepID=A0ABT9JG01_9RHOB|nr:peptidoglycan-binding domain-containing protein [Paracoccus sp. 2205BS29-5]MDP5307981.1 peptidoglycan-binding domain-containing protein [Paracoccus sp. 2205BS29-5]